MSLAIEKRNIFPCIIPIHHEAKAKQLNRGGSLLSHPLISPDGGLVLCRNFNHVNVKKPIVTTSDNKHNSDKDCLLIFTLEVLYKTQSTMYF